MISQKCRNSLMRYLMRYVEMEDLSLPSILQLLGREFQRNTNLIRDKAIDLIIANISDRYNQMPNFAKRGYIELYVIGSFRKTFRHIDIMAKIMAPIYLETIIMPNLSFIAEREYLSDLEYFRRLIEGGMLLYDIKEYV